VPTGSVQTFAGFIVPTGWLLCDNTPANRITYAALFAVLSKSSSGDTHTSTLIDNIPAGGTTNVVAGWYISGPGIQAGTTVTVVGATSLTLSLATTASTNGVPFTAAPYGIGDGTTTFNVPDCRGVFVRGAGVQTISAKVFTGVLGAKVVDTTAVNGLSTVAHNHAALAPTFGANVFQNIAVNTGSSHLVPAYGGVANGSMVTGTTTASVSSSETETTPGNIALNYIIKT
jgi:microcystin-dependent protein